MVDLDTCNEEPIQFIESIQDFGALLAIDDKAEIQKHFYTGDLSEIIRLADEEN